MIKDALTQVSTWTIDQAHSKIFFKVKHLVVSTVTGTFDDFEGMVESSGTQFDNARVIFSAKTNSVNTHNKDRDEHLRSTDFFNSEKYPLIRFKSTSFNKIGDDEYWLSGELNIRGITKEVNLHATYLGETTDPFDKTKAAFEITGRINRKDFGLSWSVITEGGGAVVSDEIKLLLEITIIMD